jgi:hypothetical protein
VALRQVAARSLGNNAHLTYGFLQLTTRRAPALIWRKALLKAPRVSGECTVRAGKQNIGALGRKARSKKSRSARRQTPKRRVELKTSSWYQTALMSVAIHSERHRAQ